MKGFNKSLSEILHPCLLMRTPGTHTPENLKRTGSTRSLLRRPLLRASPAVAKLFRAASEAEAVHAKRILFIMNAVGSTEENLKGAMEGENYEFMQMHPPFVEEAKAERKNEAAIVFTHAMKAEEVHANLYLQALEAVREGKDLDVEKIYLCPVCGNIELGAAPEKRPIRGRFRSSDVP